MTDLNNGVKVTDHQESQPSLMERLYAYPHMRIHGDVDEAPVDRTKPTIAVWPSCDDGHPSVTIMIDMLWGEQQRFAELTPDQARALARMLVGTAAIIEREVQQEHASEQEKQS